MRNPIFASAGKATCKRLAARYPARPLPPGTVVLDRGSRASLFVVLEGAIRIFHRAMAGDETTVKLARAPMIAGDMEIIQGLPILESVATIEPSLLAQIPAAEYLDFLRHYPRATFEQLRHTTAAFCVAARTERAILFSAEQRTAQVLLSYARFYGRPTSCGTVIDYPLSLQSLADSLGLVRRSVALLITRWREQGVIARKGERFVLHEPSVLEALAHPIADGLCYQMGMPLEPVRAEPDAPVAEIEFVEGPAHLIARRIRLERDLVIGKDSRCHVVLVDDELSHQHCRIHRGTTGGRYWVEDLDTLAGTTVDGKRIRRAVLRDGSCIGIGSIRLRFHSRPTQGAS